jgi:sulfotransferase
MPKKIYFLSGFPRSGNTIISTILNQNKDMAVSGHSSLVNCFFNLEQVKKTCTYDNFKDEKSVENIKKKLVHNYYNDWPQKYIIDRGEWGTPYNYSVMEKYCPNEFKIIFLLRNPIDVIKSYVKLCNDYPDFYINQQYNELDKTSLHRTELEEKIELITKKEDLVYWSFTAYNFLKDKQNVHFVKYEDFVEDPKKILNGIYDFLDIPKFEHSFDIKDQFSINGIEYNDDVLGAPMHKLHTGTLKKFNYPDIELPKHIIEKYKGMIYEQ